MIKTLLLAVAFSASLQIAVSVNLDCLYQDILFHIPGKEYACRVRSNLHINSLNSEIDSVTGTHTKNRTNDDVIAFYVDTDKDIQYLPKGLDKFFKNLKVIWIQNNKVKEIHQSDLKMFPNLVYLKLVANNIRVLENGLFDFNRNLRGISMERNKIAEIGEHVFDNLQLTHLNFFVNPCIDGIAVNNATYARAIIEEAKRTCQDKELFRFNEQLTILENMAKILNSDNFSAFKQKLQEFEDAFSHSKYSKNSTLMKRFEDLKNLERKKSFSADQDEFEVAASNVYETKSCVNCCQSQKPTCESDVSRQIVNTLTHRIDSIERNLNEKLQKILEALGKH